MCPASADIGRHHVIAGREEAPIGIVLISERIFIADAPKIKEGGAFAMMGCPMCDFYVCFDQRIFGSGECISRIVKTNIALRWRKNQISTDGHASRRFRRIEIVDALDNGTLLKGRHVIRGRLPVIFYNKLEDLVVLVAVVNDSSRRNSDVGAHLLSLGIARNPSLISASDTRSETSYRCQKCEEASPIIQPILIFVIGIVAFAAGFSHMYFGARTGGFRTWISGAVLLILGWCACIAGGLWFLISLSMSPIPLSSHLEPPSASSKACSTRLARQTASII